VGKKNHESFGRQMLREIPNRRASVVAEDYSQPFCAVGHDNRRMQPAHRRQEQLDGDIFSAAIESSHLSLLVARVSAKAILLLSHLTSLGFAQVTVYTRHLHIFLNSEALFAP
jgi:hypothetical protein